MPSPFSMSVSYYGTIRSPGGQPMPTTFEHSFDLSSKEAAALIGKEWGENFVLPAHHLDALNEQIAGKNLQPGADVASLLELDHIAQIKIVDAETRQLVVNYYVRDAHFADSYPNHWRPFEATDTKKFSLDEQQANAGRGIFVKALDSATHGGRDIRDIILGPKDKLLRRIGDAFVVTEPTYERAVNVTYARADRSPS